MAPYQFTELAKILKAEKDVHDRMLNLAVQKADAVVRGNIEDLHLILEQEYDIQDEQRKLAKEREHTTSLLADQLGVAHGAITMRAIIASASQEEAKELEELRGGFSTTLKELAIQNETNRRMIQVQLDTVGASIQMMAQTTVLGNNYTRSGASEETAHRVNLIDTTA